MTCCKLVVLSTIFSWQGTATAIAQQDRINLEYRKANLEVQKLELEINKIKKDRSTIPIWLSGLVALLVGILASAASIWVAYRTRLGTLDQSVHDKRLEFYPGLIKATAPLAIFFPGKNLLDGTDSPVTSIGSTDCRAMGRAMSSWYFTAGGLLLSVKARDAYFRLARALTRASLAEELRMPNFPSDANHISKNKIDDYRALLTELKYDLNNEDEWRFGGDQSEEQKLAVKFKDYVFLQRLCSLLRTELTQDLRSRRRPS